ncbi:MAG: twin-arginine translocase subunit TatC [Gammaproteobacteria bacterium]|nr:twin-arginine translocase subunit TatC [Gammaproteobacteria bacterium]
MNLPNLKPSKDELSDTEQPLVAHLIELRDRILWSFYGLLLAIIALAVWPGPSGLIDFLAQPIRQHLPPESKLIAVGVLTPILIPLKILLLAGFILAFPWILYQIWAFVAPGLYAHEKRLALPLILVGSVLMYIGLAFVHFFVLDRLFAFIQTFTPQSVAATPDIASFVSTILSLYLAFSLAFQEPVLIVLLVKFRILTIQKLKQWRSYFIIIAFVIAAIVTPPDVISQLALAIPLCILYEVGILFARWLVPQPLSNQPSE